MIHFTKKVLPNTVVVNGRTFLIKTDYRVWIEFGEMLKSHETLETVKYSDILPVLEDDSNVPYVEDLFDLLQGILEFYADKNVCPIDYGGSGEMVIDYNIDSDYIYSAFLQQYGIDLVDCDLHWHKFLALIRSISDDTMLGKIMSYRGYKKSNKDYDKQMRELKAIWALPVEYTEEEKKKIAEFDALFD